MVNRLPLRLVWPSRHLLYRKMTKDKSREDIKYYYFLYQNRSWKNGGNINRISEISKIDSLHSFFVLQPTVDLSFYRFFIDFIEFQILRYVIIIIVVIIIIFVIIISFFKVDFNIPFYNYKKAINANLPKKPEKNSDTKRFANSLLQ